MGDDKSSSASSVNVRCVIFWAVLLFVLTLLGGLPLFLGGLNLNRISSSTPHLPIILAGMLVSACAPTLAALFVAGLYPGAGGVRSVLRQVRTWRVGVVWYALAVIGPIILFLVVDVIHIALGGAPPAHWLVFRLLSGFGPGSMFWVVFGSLFAEELGWRGFAQPRLQDRFGALRASIVIGVVWATWHLWPVITPGGLSPETSEDAAATYIRMISTAVVYAWMYNSTNSSLFLVMVAHFGHNFAGSIVQTPSGSSHFHLTIALLYLVVALGIVLTTDSRTLTRANRCRPAAFG
jgi:membrane protease YdiL (CAAX protease family)